MIILAMRVCIAMPLSDEANALEHALSVMTSRVVRESLPGIARSCFISCLIAAIVDSSKVESSSNFASFSLWFKDGNLPHDERTDMKACASC